MIAPFCQPDLEWDFRSPRVVSINTSGHKYGLVYPGLGWIVWGDTDALPDSMVFHCSHLGGDMPTLALNFSRPGAQVLLQYYNFLRLGRAGCSRSAELMTWRLPVVIDRPAGTVRAGQQGRHDPGVRVAPETRLPPTSGLSTTCRTGCA